jgi:hypothetical protein
MNVAISPETLPENIPNLSDEDLAHFYYQLEGSLNAIRQLPRHGPFAPEGASRVADVIQKRLPLLKTEIEKRRQRREPLIRLDQEQQYRRLKLSIKNFARRLQQIVMVVNAVAVGTVAVSLAVKYAPQLLPPLHSLFEKEWVRAGYIIGILVSGGLLFLFRLKFRWYYGILEISSAAVLGWHALGNIPGGTPGDIAALLGVAYLVVRGLDNCHQAQVAKESAPGREGRVNRWRKLAEVVLQVWTDFWAGWGRRGQS